MQRGGEKRRKGKRRRVRTDGSGAPSPVCLSEPRFSPVVPRSALPTPPFLPPVLYTIASCDNEQYELRCILFCGSLRSALRARSSAERYYSASRGRQLPARNNSDKFRGTSQLEGTSEQIMSDNLTYRIYVYNVRVKEKIYMYIYLNLH